MNEKIRTIILLSLLAIGIVALWYLNHELTANFIQNI